MWGKNKSKHRMIEKSSQICKTPSLCFNCWFLELFWVSVPWKGSFWWHHLPPPVWLRMGPSGYSTVMDCWTAVCGFRSLQHIHFEDFILITFHLIFSVSVPYKMLYKCVWTSFFHMRDTRNACLCYCFNLNLKQNFSSNSSNESVRTITQLNAIWNLIDWSLF